VRTILITGGTGFVGQHLIRLLASTATRIVAISSSVVDSVDQGVEYRKLDLRKPDAVNALLREIRPEEIYHLAGITAINTSWEHPRRTFDVNVTGTYNLFETAMSLDSPPRILNVSTAQVYAPSLHPLTEDSPLAPENPYAVTKAMAEFLARPWRQSASRGIFVARAFNHTGPGQSLNFVLPSLAKQFVDIRAGRCPPTITVGNVEVRRDFTDVRDVVRAYQMLLASGGPAGIYNVCSGVAIRLADIIGGLESLTGVRVSLQVDPARLRSNDVPQVCGNPTKLRLATGWSPRFSLKQILAELLDYWSAPR
jgi:GDP-4-dehydro-6-deoxy-D-mannose reductase